MGASRLFYVKPLHVVLFVITFLLASCGGGSGSGGGASTGEFSFVEGGIPSIPLRSDVGNNHAATEISMTFDKSGDGYPDIFNVTSYFGHDIVGDAPAKSTITYFENNNGEFTDKTLEVFGTREIDYFTRRLYLHDLNADGAMDFLLVQNNEDGRDQSNADNNTAPLRVFLSQPNGTYNNYEIGYKIWSHDVSISDFDSDGKIEIIDAGFAIHSSQRPTSWEGVSIYEINPDGSWIDDTDAAVDSKIFDAGRHELNDYNKDGCADLATQADTRFGTLVYFSGNCDGSFIEVSRYDFGGPIFSVPGISWSNTATNFRVMELDNKWYAGMSISWSKSFDVDQDGDLDIIYSVSGMLVSEQNRLANFISENDGAAVNNVFLLRNNGANFTLEADPLVGMNPFMFLSWSNEGDFNNDGTIDLVVYNFTPDGNFQDVPGVIFLNDGSGKFSNPVVEWTTTQNHLLPIDYNQDGIIDLVGFSNPNGSVPNAPNTYLYKGNVLLSNF